MPLRATLRELKSEFPKTKFVFASYWSLAGKTIKEVRESGMGGLGHACEMETSLMLHFRPDLVDMAKAENFLSNVARAEQTFDLLRQTGTHAYSWIASDLNQHGVVGNASIATAEKGRLTAEFQADGFIRLLGDVRKARLADWLP